MATNQQISVGQHKLTTDMLASAMSGLTLPPNWWGYGMPPELTPGTSQITDMRGKTPMTSAPPNAPVNQSPRYTTTTTARPHTGNPQDSMFQMPNASAESMLMQQRPMAQSGYVDGTQLPIIGSTYADER